MNDYLKYIDWPHTTKSVLQMNVLQTADSDIIVSLHLVIPFISMIAFG
jgi:hypothetical protein